MVTVNESLTLPIRSEEDIVRVRSQVKAYAQQNKLSLLDQTKLITAASEIARNTLIYGLGGDCKFEILLDGYKVGIKLSFIDKGPGIENIELALKDGFTSGKGLGLGLGGSKRLVDEFNIISKPNKGTSIILVKWK